MVYYTQFMFKVSFEMSAMSGFTSTFAIGRVREADAPDCNCDAQHLPAYGLVHPSTCGASQPAMQWAQHGPT